MADDNDPAEAEPPAPDAAAVAALVSGIISDFQSLVKQQVELTRRDLFTNIRLRRTALAIYAMSVAVGCLSMVMLCFGLVHGLYGWATPVAVDVESISIAGCFGIVGLFLLAICIGLLWLGYVKFRSLSAWPPLAEQILQEQQR